MTAVRTPSQVGASNRRRGATCERTVARYLSAWWPDCVRAIRNTTPDPGDLANTSPSLWWSVKDCAVERYPEWFAEMAEKAAGRVGVLVVRRRGCADVGRWWCWLRLDDLRDLIAAPSGCGCDLPDPDAPVRLELNALVTLLDADGYTQVQSAQSATPIANPERTRR